MTDVAGTSVAVTDLYLPSGSHTMHVADASGFAVGDTVKVRRVGNARWLTEIGMDSIYTRPNTDPSRTSQWTPFNLDFDRTITAIEGNRITIDAPIADAIDLRWGGGSINKVTDEGRISMIGFENFLVDTEFDPTVFDTLIDDGIVIPPYYADENHLARAIVFEGVKNGWVRNITAYHLSDPLVEVGRSSKWITIQDSNIEGEAPPEAPEENPGPSQPPTLGSSTATSGSNVPKSPSENEGISIRINGQQGYTLPVRIEEVNGQQKAFVLMDEAEFATLLEGLEVGTAIAIPVTTNSDAVVLEWGGRLMERILERRAILELQSEKGSYRLPAELIELDTIIERLGGNLDVGELTFTIEIGVPSEESLQVAADAADRENIELLLAPIEFKVNVSDGEQLIELTRFDAYVDRTIALPEGVDRNRISTGVVIDPSGTIRSVPTKIVISEDGSYALIRSMTNSVYSVVWSPIEFADMTDHWAKDAVHEIGSRRIVNGFKDGRFYPDREVTRAEFASMLVRAFGLKPENGTQRFTDVRSADWFHTSIQTAYAYGLLSGYEWAVEGALHLAGLGILRGRNDGDVAAQQQVTRAEAAAWIKRSLEAADFIDE